MSEKPEGKVPWPKTEEELLAYIREMITWPDGAADMGEGYGRCVYAMSNAALATFNYIAGTLGVTGFQAGCAEMQFLRDSRHMEHGFMILDAENLLYPQYDLRGRVEEWIEKTRPHLKKAAQEKLAENPNNVHPDVQSRWEEIAALPDPVET
jgi:hypothetical protein